MTTAPKLPAIIDPQLLALAKRGTPPDFLGVTDEDWGAWPEQDRLDALTLYRDEVEESAVGIKPEFPRIKMPTGGSTKWIMPDGSAQDEVEGIIVYKTAARGFWESAKVTNKPPDCASFDGKHPATGRGPNGATECTNCPKNMFGTDQKGGHGKACKERLNLFLWFPGTKIPHLLPLPPTGLRPFSRYVMGLLSARPPKALVAFMTALRLEARQGENPYAVVAPREGRKLAFTEMTAAIKMRDLFRAEMERRGVTEAEIHEDAPEVEVVESSAREPGDEDQPARTDSDIPF